MPTKWPNESYAEKCTKFVDADPKVTKAIWDAGETAFDSDNPNWGALRTRLVMCGCPSSEIPTLTIDGIYQWMIQGRECSVRVFGATNTNTYETTWPLGNQYAPIEVGGDGKVRTAGGNVPKESQAVALLIEHRDWTADAIAKVVGVARQTLYDWPHFMAAWKARKAPANIPQGRKDQETGHIEADDD